MKKPTHKSKSVAALPCNRPFAATHMLFFNPQIHTNMKRILLTIGFIIISIALFSQRSEKTYYNVAGYNENTAKQYFGNSPLNDIEGIWQSTDGFKYSIEKDVENGYRSESKFRMIILENAGSYSWWKPTYIKAFIEYSSVNGIYSMKYYTNSSTGGDLEAQNCFVVLENKAMLTFTRIDNGDKIMLVKLYPIIDEKNTVVTPDNSQVASGTGFAISSNGYIVTNHHVINGAKKIEIRGVNQNYNQSYSAEVVISDERNDLAIIKINDPLFSSLGTIPYALRNNLADVGENVFVLGYPLTTTMGTEVKLTNGIISSKTGFQGDISTYQISAPVQPGNSGGPLFDNSGNLIGIVNAKHGMAENAGYAIKVSYLKNLIELINNPPNLPAINTISSKTLPEKVKVLSNFVYVVLVNDFSGTGSSNISGSNQTYDQNSSKNSQFYYNQASAKYQNKDYDGAYIDITKSIEADPNNSGAYYFRGILNLYNKRNFELAVNDFTKCIQMKPEVAESYFMRGIAYESLEKYIEANKDYTSSIKIDKDNLDAYFRRGLVKSNLGDRAGAIIDYDYIINYKGSKKNEFKAMATTYNNKAYCLVELGNNTEALPLVNKALDIEKGEAYIWDTRGEIFYNLQEYEKCIKDMDKALSIAESENSYYIRGLAKIKLGKKSEGCSDLSKSGELGKTEAYEAIKINCK